MMDSREDECLAGGSGPGAKGPSSWPRWARGHGEGRVGVARCG